jgi:septal ring factor EnvC (AmiA/AmiB activator)
MKCRRCAQPWKIFRAGLRKIQPMSPIAEIEQRIAELTHQLQQVSQPDLGPLEQRISALDSQLATAAGQQAQPDAALGRTDRQS